MKEITLSRDSIRFLLFQRSGYRFPILRILRTIFKELGVSQYYDKYLDTYLFSYIEQLRLTKISEMYFSDLETIYNNIKEILPKNAINVLDIGSGMAGIDLFIANHYNYTANIYLLDKEGESDKIVAGYHHNQDNFSHYNCFEFANNFLVRNGVPISKIHNIDISTRPFPSKIKFNLIISLLSWGFHYPIDTYIDAVYEGLSEDGILIMDIRKDTRGEYILEKYFGTKPILLIQEKNSCRYAVKKINN